VLALVATGHIRGERVACRPGFAQSKEVTYTADNLSGSPICEPCVEASTAYYGNNLRLAPDYGVESFQGCRALCRKEKRCAYFTHDSENSWCYLKTAKTAPRSKKGSDKRYTSGPSSDECESDSENEIDDNLEESLKDESDPEEVILSDPEEVKLPSETERTATDTKVDPPAKNYNASETKSELGETTQNETKITKSRVPILSVFHEDGSRTVLTALPATFGMPIINETKVSGRLILLPSNLCSAQPNVRLRPWLLSWRSGVETKLFAAVRRGGCRFAKKALHAANAGFAGLVILDDQEDTDTPRISGTHSPNLDSFPVIFLLKTEARILEKHLMESSSLSIAIQDSSTFSWYSRTSTTDPTSKKKGKDDDGFLIGMRDVSREPPSQWPFGPIRPFRPSRPTEPPSRMTVKEDPSVSREPSRDFYSGSILQMSPLTLGSLIVGVLVLLLLITSVTTLLVSRYTRRKRRRANHTRCQLAIRNMEAQGLGSHDNSGFSGGEESGQGAKGLPKSARNLLECPVCLELAWPPKKIYQCREGHIICEECKSNPALKVCPMCRIPLANNLTSRNRQLEELARALKEEDDGCFSNCNSPSAPPLPHLTTLTATPPIPASVFTVTTSVDIEVGSTTATAPVNEEHEVDEGVGAGRPDGELRVDEGVVRVTSSVAAGPLTVVLPPEYRDHF